MRKVKVGGVTYSIEPDERACLGNNTLGEAHYTAQEIIYSEAPPEATQRATILHEIIHCILYDRHRDECNNEDFIDTFSSGLYQVLVDNPDLFEWITTGRQS